MSVADLEESVRSAAARWKLSVAEPLVGGTSSAVVAVLDDRGRDLVLKIPARRTSAPDPAAVEAAALTAWAHTGAAVRLVDVATDALLLVRARPGALRPWRPEGSLDDTVDLSAELLSRLWSAEPGFFRYPTLAEVYPEQESVARADAALEQRQRGEPDRGMPGLVRLPAASVAAEQLMATALSSTLLHGDFITKNLVSDATSPAGWVALDPLPMIGDPAAEVAAFAAYHPAELILPLAEMLALRLHLDPRRALRWAAVWAVHQAAQAWREDQTELERLVVSAALNGLLTT